MCQGGFEGDAASLYIAICISLYRLYTCIIYRVIECQTSATYVRKISRHVYLYKNLSCRKFQLLFKGAVNTWDFIVFFFVFFLFFFL